MAAELLLPTLWSPLFQPGWPGKIPFLPLYPQGMHFWTLSYLKSHSNSSLFHDTLELIECNNQAFHNFKIWIGQVCDTAAVLYLPGKLLLEGVSGDL